MKQAANGDALVDTVVVEFGDDNVGVELLEAITVGGDGAI